jgi:hypothetical protein
MNMNFNDKTNNELLLAIKQMEIEHEMLKQKMLKDWDNLLEIETNVKLMAYEINKRLKPNN